MTELPEIFDIIQQQNNEPGVRINRLNQQVTAVTTVLTFHGVKNVVEEFPGKSKHFREWVQAIEKYRLLTHLNENIVKC
ncbi:hypothetical protein ACF0H5_022567 [Mactra antiquata]